MLFRCSEQFSVLLVRAFGAFDRLDVLGIYKVLVTLIFRQPIYQY